MPTAVHKTRLGILYAHVNSSLAFDIVTPRACQEVFVKIGKADNSGYYSPIKCQFSPERNAWWCYVPSVYFPVGGVTQYKVVAKDFDGYRFNIGQQILRVVADSIYDPNEDVNASVLRDCHIQMDGEWYAVRVRDDGTQLAFTVSQDAAGFETDWTAETGDSPTQTSFKDPYAYDANTKTYHKVTAYRDDTGAVCAYVDEDGVPEGERVFCYDVHTGFWYALDATVVDGEESLVVGERK